MGRIYVHLHGAAKEKSYAKMIEVYGSRLKQRNIEIKIHSNKKNLEQYYNDLNKLTSLYLLDERGVEYSSVEFAKVLNIWHVGTEDVNIAIGPVEGWQNITLSNSNLISLSKMTLPHELAAVILVEQIYRATEINRGSQYHRM